MSQVQVSYPQLGGVWRSRHGKEGVVVRRAWHWPGQGPTVRVHPIRGGRPLVAALDWFLDNYERDGTDA